MSRLFKLLFLSSGLYAAGCYYDVEEELYPKTDCDTSAVTYSATVQPIISNRCYVCHGAGINLGNVTLEGYDNIKNYALNGDLLGAIKHQPGYSPMPQSGGMLPDCEIQKIEAWIAGGALQN